MRIFLMNRTSVSVSCRGDRAYVQALRALAATRGLDMADVVRKALDTTFGGDIKPYLECFVAHNEDKYPHSKEAVHNSDTSSADHK
jgi:hypothetical protein